MTPEETPLLDVPAAHDVYDRFSTKRKKVILALVATAGVFPLFVASSFLPTIPQIAEDMNSTASIINLAVSLTLLSAAIGSLVWSSYSGFYGRRPIYLCALPALCIGSIGVGRATSVMQLMAWRVVQAIGCSCGFSIGSGVIGDIYRLEERGMAMGVFFSACLLGPALAPFAGGIAAHYYSWRYMQYALGLSGFLAFILVFFCFPETCHPHTRGVDKLTESSIGHAPRWKWVWINPLSSLWLLRSPNLMAVCLAGTTVLVSHYILLVPLAYTIGARYDITNSALIGACFLPAGLGNIIGAPAAGWLSDRVIVKWKKRRGGEWVPEDRLRATLEGALFLVPLSVLASGFITHFIGGRVGLILNLCCLFINGLGVDLVLSPLSAYGVDVMHSRSAEVVAVTMSFRSVITSAAVAGILPLLNLVGVVVTNAISAGLAWLGFGLLWCTIRYGDQMRAWVDVGYDLRDH